MLSSLGLAPSEVSTQIVQPEPLTDLMHAIVSTFGVLANFSRDMRNLQRTEISEVSEEFSESQVGSSTMPQKRNPINFENVESTWKKFMPQMVTVYLDQVSEHQRDLTNSLSQRYLPELLVAFDSSVRRLTRTVWDVKGGKPRISIDSQSMKKNLGMSADTISAEPLYILLALAGHPDAHESVRRIVQLAILGKEKFPRGHKVRSGTSKVLCQNYEGQVGHFGFTDPLHWNCFPKGEKSRTCLEEENVPVIIVINRKFCFANGPQTRNSETINVCFDRSKSILQGEIER